MSADYRMSTIVLTDGRVLNGVVGNRTGPTLSVQTPTERIVVNGKDVEEIRASNLSLMPEGLLDVLSEKEMRDLTAYLMSPQQVPLEEAGPALAPRPNNVLTIAAGVGSFSLNAHGIWVPYEQCVDEESNSERSRASPLFQTDQHRAAIREA